MSTDIRHPFFARIYPRIDRLAQHHGGRDHRRELLTDVSGDVVEIGAGHGANFAFYPATTQLVTAVEPEPRLRTLAGRAAVEAPVPVRVVAGLAEALPLPDASVDAVVASLVLCTIADVPAALAEAHRVLVPGGRLFFYEHIRSTDPAFARRQQRLDRVWPFLAGGCHLSRTPEADLGDAGFTVERARHFDFLVNGRRSPASPCVIGVALKK